MVSGLAHYLLYQCFKNKCTGGTAAGLTAQETDMMNHWGKLTSAMACVLAFSVISAMPAFAHDEGGCECVDINDNPRPCTASENFDCCLENAVEAADNRADDGEGTKFSRFLDFTADVAECAVGYIGDITFK